MRRRVAIAENPLITPEFVPFPLKRFSQPFCHFQIKILNDSFSFVIRPCNKLSPYGKRDTQHWFWTASEKFVLFSAELILCFPIYSLVFCFRVVLKASRFITLLNIVHYSKDQMTFFLCSSVKSPNYVNHVV